MTKFKIRGPGAYPKIYTRENMKIIDINGAEREVISVKKIKHKITDIVNGTDIIEDYVEVEIVGVNTERTWKEWYPIKEFQEKNPEVNI